MSKIICEDCPISRGCEVVPYDIECDEKRQKFISQIKSGECKFSCKYFDWDVGSCIGGCECLNEVTDND